MLVFQILFGAAFTFVSCLAVGKLLIKSLDLQLYRSEELFLGYVLGSAILSSTVFLLGTMGLAYPPVFFITGCASLVLVYRFHAWRFSEHRLPPLPRPWKVLFAAIYGIFACIYFLAALSPEASADGPVYHVSLPALYLRQHRIIPMTSNLLTYLSEGMEMLFLFAFAFGKHSAAAMVHLSFTLLTPVGILSYAKRIGFPQAGVVGALLFFLSPAVALVGTTAYVDIALAAAVFGVFYVLQIWWVEQADSLLIPLGILAGFGYGIKYTAGIALPYALGGILVRRFRSGKPIWRPCAIVSLTAFALMSPWIVKNIIVVHNPVAPFANRVFPNPFVYGSTERQYAESIASPNGLTALTWPYQITTRGNRTQGFLGPVFLLAPLALLSLSSAAGRQLLCAGGVFLLPCIAAVPSRYFLPGLCFVSLALALVLSRYVYVAAGVILVHALLCWPALIPKYASRNAPFIKFPDWRAAVRLTPESEYLSKRVEGYGLGGLLDAKLRADERVFALRLFQQAYHSRDVWVAWQSALGVRLGESLRAPFDSSLQPTRQYVFSFEPATLSKIRLVQTARHPAAAEWSVSELRVFYQGRELPRGSDWRLSASPNPWDVQLAFDNSPLTRWDSRQPPAEAMFIQVDFGKPQTLDRLTVDCVPDQHGIQMALRTQGSPGSWRDLDARIDTANNPMPPRLRRAAIEDLERHHIHALAIHDLDPGSKDFSRRQAQWGIELVGGSGFYRLYLLK